MGEYAKGTTVAPEQSRMEIERTLMRYGAKKFMYYTDDLMAVIMFEAKERRIKFVIKLPPRAAFTKTPTGKARTSQNAVQEAYEQAVRQRWRALALVIKAKLESIESGIETFEEAFMSQIVLPDGRTAAEWAVPQIKLAYETGNMPPLLGSGT
jgi:hypothetical protein